MKHLSLDPITDRHINVSSLLADFFSIAVAFAVMQRLLDLIGNSIWHPIFRLFVFNNLLP